MTVFTRCDDTVFRWLRARFGLPRPAEKWQHRLSSRTPRGTELASRQLIKSEWKRRPKPNTL